MLLAIIISTIVLIGFFGILMSVKSEDTTYQSVPVRKSVLANYQGDTKENENR